MNTEFMWFQKCLTDDRYNPGARPVPADNEQKAKRIVKQIAIDGPASTIIVLFVHEGDKSPRAICGWRKGASDTIRPLQQKDADDYLEKFTAARWWDN